ESQSSSNYGDRHADVHSLGFLAFSSGLVHENAKEPWLCLFLIGLDRRADRLQQLLRFLNIDLSVRQHFEHFPRLFVHRISSFLLSRSSACATVNSPRATWSSTSLRVAVGVSVSDPCSISTNDNWLPILLSLFLMVG